MPRRLTRPTRSYAPAVAAAPTPPTVPVVHGNAAQTDPNLMGWMQGHPPPEDKLVHFADASHMRFPQLRWSLSNFAQLVPTKTISRGDTPVWALPRLDRHDLDGVTFTPVSGSLGNPEPMTWGQALDANYTDGIVVLHQGAIVYERYFGALTPHKQHLAFSVTKSFVGLIAASMVVEGTLDAAAKVSHYVPELSASAFGSATIRQVMDMVTGLQYSEVYTDPKAEIWDHARAGGILSRPAHYSGPQSFYAFLQTVKMQGHHGQGFMYKTVNTDVLGWVLRRITGLGLAELISQRIWSRLGCEQDAYVTVDTAGTEFAGGGLCTSLRDLARFGEMVRMDGAVGSRQIVPLAAIDDIRGGASCEDFKMGGYASLPGWSYRSMWWNSHNPHGAFMARGIHGQAVYVDPLAQMVIARYASHHIAGNMGIDPQSLPAYHAMAQHLMES